MVGMPSVPASVVMRLTPVTAAREMRWCGERTV